MPATSRNVAAVEPGMRRALVDDPTAIVPATGAFTKPRTSIGPRPPITSWIFASSGYFGEVDVYNEGSLEQVSYCTCGGAGLAVDPRNGNLAVGVYDAPTVTVWHVAGAAITQFATLNLSADNPGQTPYPLGIAFDKKGDLYASHWETNKIDVFSAGEIKAGGGDPVRTILTHNLQKTYYIAAEGRVLVADGYSSTGATVLVKVDPETGADVVLQTIATSGESEPFGIAFDRKQNLIFNEVTYRTSTLITFKRPWTGQPTSSFKYGYGDGSEYSYYGGISLNQPQDKIWGANVFEPYISEQLSDVQEVSYPLGRVGLSSDPLDDEFYISVALDPQAKD
jgi:hypothetical protein